MRKFGVIRLILLVAILVIQVATRISSGQIASASGDAKRFICQPHNMGTRPVAASVVRAMS